MWNMMRVVMLMAFFACGGSGEPAPSCSQAFTAYYAAGCTFVDLDTGQPIPKNTIISECQSGTSSTPAQCRGDEDDFLRCINDSTPAQQCDCSQEQMALLRCG